MHASYLHRVMIIYRKCMSWVIFKAVPNTSTKINLARLIFIKFWQGIFFDLWQKYKNFKKFEPTVLSEKLHWLYSSLTNTNFDHLEA